MQAIAEFIILFRNGILLKIQKNRQVSSAHIPLKLVLALQRHSIEIPVNVSTENSCLEQQTGNSAQNSSNISQLEISTYTLNAIVRYAWCYIVVASSITDYHKGEILQPRYFYQFPSKMWHHCLCIVSFNVSIVKCIFNNHFQPTIH